MRSPDTTPLSEGYRLQFFADLDSTNAEALRQAGQGATEGLWIRAGRQSAGRGRSGRRWDSESGNLFASLLLRPACTLEMAVQLAFVAGLAAFDAVAALAGGFRDKLVLKWPNDLLLGMEKIGGILLESAPSGTDARPAIILGTGLNIVSHPGDAMAPATDLRTHGIKANADDAFRELAAASARWIGIWRNGAGWPDVRSAWREHSLPEGAMVSVKTGGAAIEGRFEGIDERGALLIDTGAPSARVITAGDVFLK